MLAMSSHSFAAYDESELGDLSGDIANPSLLIVLSDLILSDSEGNVIEIIKADNTISGTVGNNGNTGATNGSDADVFRFSFIPSVTLSAINVISSSGDDQSFIGYAAGQSFSGQTASDVDGFTLFGNSSGNILDELIGGPVSGGDHVFWIQETANLVQSYELEFVFDTTPVPVPAAVWLFGSGILALMGLRVRRG